ncbi:MAG: hypothetical protein GX872_00880 [Firmicutes bacterium]|nr:hypothetical protein [Bacillota bacterium]HXL04855.1 hypothetical protein [Bacillota bacterium]
MGLDTEKTFNQLIIMLLVGVLILIGQRIGYGIPIADAIPGMLIIIVICMISLIIKDLLPNLKFPAFAWASLIGLILCMPFMPTAESVLRLTNKVNFLGTTTPILAIAGISVGNRIDEFKKLSWRIVIISFAVFAGTFFGSAIIAHIVLKIQGII